MSSVAAQRTVRPVRHLAWRTAVAGNIAVVVPGAAVAVVIAAQDGRPVIAGTVALVSLLVAAFAVVPALRIRTRLEPGGVTTFWTGRLGSTTLPKEDVRRALVRTIYNSDGVSTNRHLFLLDAQDRTLLRMSDRWWTDEQLLTVAHHFEVTIESQNQPVHLVELRRTARQHLRWTERHRVTWSTLLVVSTFLACTAFAALATAAL
jgi:hypothetical protein